jgi:Spy/CpxP family protein refolding chaperone
MNPVLISAALFTALFAADPAKPPDAPPAPAAVKGHLLPHFKALGLTSAQKAQVETITGAASAKIHDLELQIAAVRDKEKADALAVLSDTQRDVLRKLLTAGVEDKK